MFLQNIGIYLPNYTVSHPRRRIYTQCSINLISPFSHNALLSTLLTEMLNNFWISRIQQRNLMVLWFKKTDLFFNLFYFTECSSLQSIVCTQLIFSKIILLWFLCILLYMPAVLYYSNTNSSSHAMSSWLFLLQCIFLWFAPMQLLTYTMLMWYPQRTQWQVDKLYLTGYCTYRFLKIHLLDITATEYLPGFLQCGLSSGLVGTSKLEEFGTRKLWHILV